MSSSGEKPRAARRLRPGDDRGGHEPGHVLVGSVAGPTAEIPSAALRAARLQLVGSGQGSVATRDIVAELADLAGAINDGALTVSTRTVPLADVTAAWQDTGSDQRVVIVP